jgi:hypothetical protein
MDNKETPKIQVSPAQDFKKRAEELRKPELLTLPSGLVVLVRRPQLSKILKDKLIPADLINSVYANVDVKEAGEVKPDFSNSIQFMDKLVALSLVEPVVKDVPNYDKGEIGIDDLDEEDKGHIFNFINGGRQDLKNFR